MTKPGRISCIGNGCRRTAPAEKFKDCRAICCGKCWKRVPPRLKNRYKRLNAHIRRLNKALHPNERQLRRIYRLHDRNWLAIERSMNPLTPASKPIGLDAFLAESGL